MFSSRDSFRRVLAIGGLIFLLVGIFFVSRHYAVMKEADENAPYWSRNGKFIYQTGAVISPKNIYDPFFTGATARINTQRIYNEGAPHTLLYYIESPVLSNVDNLPIINWVQREMTRTEMMLNNALAEKKNILLFPKFLAFFDVYSGNDIGAIVSSSFGKIFEDQVEESIQVFLINTKGEIFSPQTLLRLSTQKEKASFHKILLTALTKAHANKEFFPETSELFDTFLENPQFVFAGDSVILFFNPGIVADYSLGLLQITIPYEVLRPFIRSQQPIIEEKPEEEIWESSQKIKGAIDGKKYVALTFDDGPSKKTTPKLLDILKKNDVQATFFVLGNNAALFPDIIKREVEEGHEIGNHSWDHSDLVKLSAEGITSQIEKTNEIIEKITGKKPLFLRPPYGSTNSEVEKIAQMPLIYWSIDTRDWKNRNVQKNLKATLQQVHDGGIILFHDIHQQSVDTIAAVISELRKRGYSFVTVSQLYEKYHGTSLPQEAQCFSATNCREKKER